MDGQGGVDRPVPRRVGPGTTRVEVTFVAIDDGTRVTITHEGLPATHVERHAAGWGHFLSVLGEVSAGGVVPAVNPPSAEVSEIDETTRSEIDETTREVRHGERR